MNDINLLKNKTCFKCRQQKFLTKFRQFKSGIRKGEYHSYCKECEKLYRKERYRYSYLQYKKNHQWVITYWCIQSRCKYDKREVNKLYKNIKNYLTLEDLKFLWFRDRAYLLKRPSIHRKNRKGDYTISNCQYIEMRENCSEGGKIRHKLL